MDVTDTMGAGELVRKYLESDDGHDLLAEMVKMAAELLMDAEVDVLSRIAEIPHCRSPKFPSCPEVGEPVAV